MQEFVSYDEVENLFRDVNFLYFLTIKPPPDDNMHARYVLIHEYLEKKGIANWIVKCMSPNGYVHFHGLVKYDKHQELKNGHNASLKRKVQRDMGYVTSVPVTTSVQTVFHYIRAPHNNNIEEIISKRV